MLSKSLELKGAKECSLVEGKCISLFGSFFYILLCCSKEFKKDSDGSHGEVTSLKLKKLIETIFTC